MKVFLALDHVLEKALKWLTVLPFMSMVVLVACQVYTRFFTKNSLTWSEELSRYLMAYMVFFAAILVAREKSHIRIENLTGRLSGAGKKIVAVIAGLIQVAFLIIVIIGFFKFLPTAAMRTSATNHIPMSYVYLCVPISCFFMMIYFIRDIVKALMEKGEAEKKEE